ncbi:MAG: polyamine aminopropyltransferase [Minwuia sp.]|uniref:polyamine aminopropyltransferase n=1 Tax=Minwuia sp. TaxID=2493630 RepID=UPI003A845753
MTDWITEELHGGLKTSFRADEILVRRPVSTQDLVLYRNPVFGRMLALDGVTQVTEKDEFIYHEMLTHVPVLAHGNATSVLIVGGGDGGMLRETIRHPGIERVVMVEIDEGVVSFSKEHLPTVSDGAFDDPRLELVIADGADYMRTATEQFDVIIVDSTDPIGPGEVLFTDHFYGHAKARLKDGGVLVTQNGVPFMQGAELTGTMRAFRSLFEVATCYLATVPTYVGGPMAFGFGTDNPGLLAVTAETLAARQTAAGFETRYYTPDVHKAAFALPGYVQNLVSA